MTLPRDKPVASRTNLQYKGDTLMLTFKRHHSTLLRRFVLLTLICAAVPVLTTAQVLYGSLTGTVTDPKEAAVSGARVEIVNSATNETRSTTTDDRGGYSI